jgi:ppGpp synthetase/RelA/SpoT-type nucleotidyltranferase
MNINPLIKTEPPYDNALDANIISDVLSEEDMTWAQLQYTKKEVNEAGYNLIHSRYGSKEFDKAVEITDNFRASHAFPLNTLQTNLRRHSNIVDPECVIAQRLKRISSIYAKLKRLGKMKLWDMQDIGGCRTITHTVGNVNQIVNDIKSSSIRHILSHQDNYISEPRDSGYRGRHLIYRYISDRSNEYNGLKIEIQVRTLYQHYWATAVETVDAFTKQALKASMGQKEWTRFFQIMGTEMAYLEDAPPVPKTPINRIKLLKELRYYAELLNVQRTLKAFTMALKVPESVTESKYFLLSLDANAETLNIFGYSSRELSKASDEYSKLEKEIREKGKSDAVLVSVDSMHNLQRAYPNYFADTSKFSEILDTSLKQIMIY